MTQNFDANSTNAFGSTDGQTNEQKDENYIPVGINDGGIKSMSRTITMQGFIIPGTQKHTHM